MSRCACGFVNREDSRFCGQCGAPLSPEVVCSKCRRSNPAGLKFCDGCGDRLASETTSDPRAYTPPHLVSRILAEQAAMEARGAVDGERKTITALFADIKGSVELLATTSLALLLQLQGRAAEARTMLADIYGWFSEGFDTADLKEAKALLDQLS